MVIRQYVKCFACDSVTLLRIQVGWLDQIPLFVGCNGCGGTLRGMFTKDQDAGELDFTMENADIIPYENVEEVKQEIECSSELPVYRYKKGPQETLKVTPYIRNFMNMGPEQSLLFSKHINSFIHLWNTEGSKFTTVLDLQLAGNMDASLKLMSKFFPYLEINLEDPDVFRNSISNFFGLLSNFILLLFPSNHFSKSTGVFLKYYSDVYNNNINLFTPFTEFLYETIKIEVFTNDGLKLIKKFIDNINYFVPIIGLTYYNDYEKNKVFGEEYMITSSDFDRVKQIYAETYEWLSKFLVIIMGVENISLRGDFNRMPIVNKHKNKNINSLHDFTFMSNGLKLDFINTSSFLKDYYNSNLDNQLRNAVNHYKTTLDSVNQLITYSPFNDEQRANKTKDIFIIDFNHNTYKHILKIYDALYIIGMIRMITKN